jgi:MFS transporter, PPP family, 3-phenylpropionic acid transporter
MSFVCFSFFLFIGFIGPYMAQELSIREAYPLGLLLALPSLANLFASPMWGFVADKSQSWARTLQFASIAMFFGLVLLNILPSNYLLIAMLFHALGRTPIAPLIDSLILQELGRDRKKYGKKRMWGSIGFALGALCGSIIQSYSSFSLLTLSIIPAILFLFSIRNIQEPPPLTTPDFSNALQILFKDIDLFALLLAGVFHFMPLIATDVFLATHIKTLGLNPIWTGISICSGILVEIWVLHKGGDWMHTIFSPIKLFAFAVLSGLIHWICMLFVRDGFIIAIVQGLHGFEFGFFWLAIVDLISKKTEHMPATGQTILSAALGGMGAGGGIYFASWIVENYSTYHMFQWGALLEVISFLIVLVVMLREKK